MVTLYLVLVVMGWMNIYAAVFNENHSNIFDLTQNYGKQLIWILTSLIIAIAILVIDGKFFAAFSYPMYIAMLLLLGVVLILARRVAGAASWLDIGSFKLQPAEFAKFATNMALAKYLSTLNIKIEHFRTKVFAFGILAIPIAMILLQNDTGSALVYTAFIFVLYREGLSGSVLLLGVGGAVLFILALLISKYVLIGILAGLGFLLFLFVKKNARNIIIIVSAFIIATASIFSVNYVFNSILEPHQKQRINVLLGKETDLKGSGYNVNQSLIAIGSGGFFGKGFLQGTQTKFDFVPEQSTDFIFCTVGEEWGFVGCFVVISLFITLLVRIVQVAERQRSAYSRIYGYGVASILFFHLTVNVGMTIGLAPVIGIPLPFFSYGGSSLWGFTMLLFVFIKLDSYRLMILR
jgi:rod shape determining protein RodA